MDYVQIPSGVIQTNKYVTLTANVMYVNSLLFKITYGRGKDLVMANLLPNQMASQLTCNLKRIISLYSRAGFIIQTTLVRINHQF